MKRTWPIHKLVILGIGRAHILCTGRDYSETSVTVRTDTHDDIVTCKLCQKRLQAAANNQTA